MKKVLFMLITLLITTEMFADFSRDTEKEIVTDTTTGFMWQDNNLTKTTSMNFAEAKNFCEALKLGGYDDWRVPSIVELQTILDYNRFNPAIKKEFINIGSSQLSSNPFPNSTFSSTLHINIDGHIESRKDGCNVRCVRGGNFGTFESFAKLQRSGFTRDKKTKIVTDTKTNLQWQDNEAVKFTRKKWVDADRYCKELKLGGFHNWRLPRIEELLTIQDYSQRTFTLNTVFMNYIDESGYWSSTSTSDTDKMWISHGPRFFLSSLHKKLITQTRCVRDNEVNTEPLSSVSSFDDNVTKEIQHYNHPTVSDFISAEEPPVLSLIGKIPNEYWHYVKKIDENRTLYQNQQSFASAIVVKNGKNVDIESVQTTFFLMDTDKVALLKRFGIDTNETANNLVLICNDRRLMLIFDADSSNLMRIEITKVKK